LIRPPRAARFGARLAHAACIALAIVLPRPLDAAPRPIPAIARVLLVSVDGLRPDLMLRAHAPVLRSLLERGTYTLWATTTPAAVTVPSHTSMLTGVPPPVHGVEWNRQLPFSEPVWPRRPTVFELAKSAGLSTALVAGKAKLAVLAEPGTLDWSFVPEESITTDAAVADSAIALIERHAPELLFVHLPDVDAAGHDSGWGSPEQVATIANADREIGRLLDALRARGILDSTAVLVSSDHGGAGTRHGPEDERSRRIPWIAEGPGIREDYDLTRDAALHVRTEDTFATICWLLGIELPADVEGRPVRHIAADPAARDEHDATSR
jgi:predicted AlkP superfamily pyrophosphatase or phosphodiesterase